MYDVSIARLIPIIKLSYCTMRKGRERSKCYYILLFCDEIKMENQKKKKKKKIIFFFCQIGNFFLELGKKHTFWHWEWGRISAPKSGDREPWEDPEDSE